MEEILAVFHRQWADRKYVGNEDVIETIRRKVADLTAQKHRSTENILLIGPRGSGKTHLIHQVCANRPSHIPIVTIHGAVHKTHDCMIQKIMNDLAIQRGSLDHTKIGILFSRWLEKQSAANQAYPIIIVFEEFDIIAANHRQTFLYSLFDAQHDVFCPSMLIIATTTREDVLTMLERRVRSRFNPTLLAIQQLQTQQIVEIILNRFTCPKECLWNQSLAHAALDPTLLRQIQTCLDLSTPIPTILNAFLQYLDQCDPTNPILTVNTLLPYLTVNPLNHIHLLLLDLSPCQLLLLITVHKLSIQGRHEVNFEIIFKVLDAALHRLHQLDGHDITRSHLLPCFEALVAAGLLIPTKRNPSGLANYLPIQYGLLPTQMDCFMADYQHQLPISCNQLYSETLIDYD